MGSIPFACNTDVLSVESAANALNSIRRDYVFYKRAYEDRSQSPMWAHMLENRAWGGKGTLLFTHAALGK